MSYVYLADEVWCKCGEHVCDQDEHWVSAYLGFGDCFGCCTKNQFLEVTGLKRNETGDIVDEDGQVLLTAGGDAAATGGDAAADSAAAGADDAAAAGAGAFSVSLSTVNFVLSRVALQVRRRESKQACCARTGAKLGRP